MPRTKKVENNKKENNKRVVMRPVMTGAEFVDQDGVMYEKKEFYSFKSRINGLVWYKGDDGSDKKIDPNSVRDDISPRERKDLLKGEAYALGYIVEWDEDTSAKPMNYNALNDYQIDKITKQYKRDKDKVAFKKMIDQMDSIFALSYFLDKAKGELPGFLIQYCESRINELKDLEAAQSVVVPKEYKKKEVEV